MSNVRSRFEILSATRRDHESAASMNMERRLRDLARLARHFGGARVAGALIAIASALSGAPAFAQSTVTLVTNVSFGNGDRGDTFDYAQVFTTGSDAGAYRLTAVEIVYSDSNGDPISVSVCTVDRHRNPTSTCTDFAAPANFTAGTLVFTGSMELAGGTDYAVRVGKSGANVRLRTTTSDNQTSSYGWTIADVAGARASGGSWGPAAGSRALVIALKGSIVRTPTAVQLDAPSGTAGFLRVGWEALPSTSTAYHVRARPTVDTETQENIGKYFTGGRLVRVAADVRDYTFYKLVPGITYRSQVCRVTALHSLVHEGRTHSVPSFDTLGECSPWQSIRLPSAANADRNDVKVSLEFPDGSEETTLTPDTHGTLNYRVRLSGINDLSQYRSPRWGAGSWILFLKPNVPTKTVRFGPGYGQVPEYFGHVARGANLSHLTWDRPTSGYLDQTFTLTSTMRGRGPLIVELFDHRTNDRHTDLGTQRKLCVDFEDAMGDVADPCPGGGQQAVDPPTVVGAPSVSGAGDDATWSEGETVRVTLTFSEAVDVDTTNGTPALTVGLGGTNNRSATYESGSGTTELVFAYTLVNGDGAHTAMGVTPNSLALGGGTIRSAANDSDATLTHEGGLFQGASSRSTAPTVTFQNAPTTHDGDNAFTLEMRFSGTPAGLNAKRDAANVLEVSGGTVTKGRQTATGANPVWEVTIDPTGRGDVTVRVPARACTASHAVCIGGQALASAVETTVTGPGANTVAQATVSIAAPETTPVTEGTALAFTLTRTGTTDAALEVNVSVTETGAVLTGTPPTTVTFGVGSATATLSVPTVDDETHEDASTVTVTVSAGTGYTVDADAGSADGVVESEDLEPMTARFTQLPTEHDGSSAFEVRFEFSHRPDSYNWTTVRDHLFNVTGGRIVKVGRVVRRGPDRNRKWKMRVTPTGNADVTLDAKATTDCAVRRATCDSEGRKFDGNLEATILGPAGLRVADASVEEEEGATLDFVVSLSRARTERTTVVYATSDGTARAGDDYTAASGTLTFEPNETTKTVSVTVHDDSHDEGAETMTFTLSNARGARIDDATATGSIENTDPMPKAWMVRFGRTVGSHVVDGLGARLDSAGASHVTVAGIALGAEGREPDSYDETEDPFALAEWATAHREARAHTITGEALILRSSFHLSNRGGAGSADAAFAAWGQVTTGGFETEEDGVTMDGDVTTGLVGFDAEWNDLLAGVMLSQSEGDGAYRLDPERGEDAGTVEASMTGVYPYARLDVGARVSTWALAGVGTGELTLHREGGRPMPTDLSMRMGAVGVRGQVLDGTGPSGIGLSIRSDAMWVSTESEDTDELAATEGDVTRLRLTLQGERRFEQEGAGELVPSIELGLRHDGGDAETGTGVEVGAGVRYTAGSLSVEGRVRALVAHEASGYEEWGASGAIRVHPGRSGRGLTLSITPEWGRTGSATEHLWSARDASALGTESDLEPTGRLAIDAGYGLGPGAGRGVLIPYAGMTFGDQSRRTIRTGAKWQLGPDASVGLEAARSESEDAESTSAVRLRASVRF